MSFHFECPLPIRTILEDSGVVKLPTNKYSQTKLLYLVRLYKSNTKQKIGNYFFAESFFILESDIFDSIFLEVSIILLVLSIIFLDESVIVVVMLSVLTVEESVVVVEEEPDPQAAKTVTAKAVNNFFIRMSFYLIPVWGKGNPSRYKIEKLICTLLVFK